MTDRLHEFIAHARSKGMDHQTIRMLLLSSGWKEKDIAHALTEESLDMSVPMPPDTGGAREAFFHLLTFAAFYTTAISTIVLFFQYINMLFPDPALGDYVSAANFSGIRWSIAAIIVAFPLFVLLSRFLLKEMRVNPEREWSPIRRWLTYLTLFVAAASLMGDVITLVFYVLEGEITIRFILKILTVLIVAGLSFTYYFLSLKTPVDKPGAKTMHRGFGIASAVVVLVAIAWGIILAGSPASERERKFDDRRIEDLRTISSEISSITLGSYRQPTSPDQLVLQHPIPSTLQEVQDQAMYQRPNIADPETGDPYVFEVLSETTYRVCATFNAQRSEQFDVSWNHPAGYYCFERDVLDQAL